jgi:hypothetical protein
MLPHSRLLVPTRCMDPRRLLRKRLLRMQSPGLYCRYLLTYHFNEAHYMPFFAWECYPDFNFAFGAWLFRKLKAGKVKGRSRDDLNTAGDIGGLVESSLHPLSFVTSAWEFNILVLKFLLVLFIYYFLTALGQNPCNKSVNKVSLLFRVILFTHTHSDTYSSVPCAGGLTWIFFGFFGLQIAVIWLQQT